MIFGMQVSVRGEWPLSRSRYPRQDTHVPRAGRDLIRATLEDANVTTSVRLLMLWSLLNHTHHQ
jgi:hypothetical protein